ncbi:unnamed protein product [Parascedosporium putredinis]|uniref:DNA-directed RNA polymerase subunit beta n=1 Tax=Parascedosporium putredinis TaxID=1442378 RepID=A0A9P1M8Q2_9PEZI|nr:unnamed protein product [Parascedosporium putredinis]CAI7990534.1 unnamed protein product [Parascedosporium putredinis]
MSSPSHFSAVPTTDPEVQDTASTTRASRRSIHRAYAMQPWSKWSVFTFLAIPTGLNIALLVAQAKDAAVAVQVLIYIMSALLGAIHVWAVTALIRRRASLALFSGKPLTAAALRHRTYLAIPRVPRDIRTWYFIPILLVSLLGFETAVLIPSFRDLSRVKEYPAGSDSAGLELFTSEGYFSYLVGTRHRARIADIAASATSPAGSVRALPRLDDTPYRVLGRSYGIASSVGIGAQDLSSLSVLSYRFTEMGYETTVNCTYNQTSDFTITADRGSSQGIITIGGFLPDSTSGKPNQAEHFAPDSKNTVALGVAHDEDSPRTYLAIAAGDNYEDLDKIQCQVHFKFGMFQVSVNEEAHQISVTFLGDMNGADPDNTVPRTAMRQLEIVSSGLAAGGAAQSALGEVFRANVAALNMMLAASESVGLDRAAEEAALRIDGEDDIRLRGVENALTAMLDAILSGYGAAQVMVGKVSELSTAELTRRTFVLGKLGYVVAACVLNGLIVLAVAVEAVATRNWRGLPALDFTDPAWLALLEPFYNGKSLTDPISTKEDKFQLLPAFLKVKGLVKQHIDSYNFFVEQGIKDIVRANSRIKSDVESRFLLEYCRLRDMTYAAPMVVDIAYIRDKTRVIKKDVPLGRMPIMLKSSKCRLAGANNAQMEAMNECPLDPGGYFIIGGTEKVILIQEQLSKNRVIVEVDDKNHVIQASVTSSTHERKSKTYVRLKKDRIYLTHNVLVEDVPIIIVLKALSGLPDADIVNLVAGSNSKLQDDFLVNFEEAAKAGIISQQDALEYIGTKVKMGSRRGQFGGQPRRNHAEEALDVLANLVVAHVPIDGLESNTKAIYLALMARRVLLAARDPKLVDDRDFFTSEVKLNIDKFLKKNNQAVALDPANMIRNHANTIGQGLNRAIQTGNWTVKRFNMNRVGVTHVLSRLSYIAALGMMTRISSQFEKTRKVSGPRALQPSQWGMLCTSDTPEGEACGLVKNLALMTHITTNDDEEPVIEGIFMDDDVDSLKTIGGQDLHDKTHVIHLNGTPIATTKTPNTVTARLRRLRRKGALSPFVSIHTNSHYNAVHIATDEGRICRPFIIVSKKQQRLKPEHLRLLQLGKVAFDDFLKNGVVEYLDVNELNDSLVAIEESDITKAHTHIEIEPFTILGAVAGLIPFPHHNQSPRNTYQCAMGKQAIGAIAYNQFNRIDTLLYTLVYPQRPMVISKTIELIHYDKLPAGQNATVVVMSYSGYDIEDALVLNKASCDRGFGRCQVFRKYTTELQKYPNGRREQLGRPPSDGGAASGREGKYNALDEDGLATVGYRISAGETMIMKRTPIDLATTGIGLDRGPSEFRDSSINYKIPDPAYIDKVMLSHTEKETTVIKVQTRQTRRPELGDKFSSRHGQKGVVGIIVDQVDLPFSDEGLVPDIIMNPHGFPSRMTVGKLLECLTGKASMSQVLIDHGFSWEGKDYFTSGITGEPLEAYVFNGPIYYQRLKHMVQDKMHSRARGPRAILTRQPTEGRSRDGGLRLGEMERDCLIAYGASQLLLERLMISSDAVDIDICEQCGLFGYKSYCHTCKSTSNVTQMTMPYAAKLLVQELISMNVGVRLKLEDEFPHPVK